ncbi:MAG: type II secretion system GspH family protein [Chitinispirillales bacterium]|jgi:prepilin-type N-terminal cleavage/methylation domain-containing protein|nr:type II secretion system GspH family protein [Chitinispirillales bacterium]
MRWKSAVFGVASKYRFQNNRAGFSMLELIVVIAVFGIISAAAIVSWAGFKNYQDLRQEAGNFHKQILAMKAVALERGDNVTITYTAGGYTITAVEDDEFPAINRPVDLINNVTITDAAVTQSGDLPDVPADNAWGGGTITVTSSNLDAYANGYIVIENNSKNSFCIMKTGNDIKPHLYKKSGSDVWRRI